MDAVGLMLGISGLPGTVDMTSPAVQCLSPDQATTQLLWQSLSFVRSQGVPHAALVGCAGELPLAPPHDSLVGCNRLVAIAPPSFAGMV